MFFHLASSHYDGSTGINQFHIFIPFFFSFLFLRTQCNSVVPSHFAPILRRDSVVAKNDDREQMPPVEFICINHFHTSLLHHFCVSEYPEPPMPLVFLALFGCDRFCVPPNAAERLHYFGTIWMNEWMDTREQFLYHLLAGANFKHPFRVPCESVSVGFVDAHTIAHVNWIHLLHTHYERVLPRLPRFCCSRM